MDSLVESAFSVWARASGLTFVRSHTRSADIMVEFVTSGGFVFLFPSGQAEMIFEGGLDRVTLTECKKHFFWLSILYPVELNPMNICMESFSSNSVANQGSFIIHCLLDWTDSFR